MKKNISSIFILSFLFLLSTIFSAQAENTVPLLEKGNLLTIPTEKGNSIIPSLAKGGEGGFELEIKNNLINLQAEQASFKEILTDLEKKTGIKINIFDGVEDKKVTLNITTLPVYAIHTLLEKMALDNFAVVYDKELASKVIYILPKGADIAEVIKGKTIIRSAQFADGKNVNQIKGHEIITISRGKNNIPVRYVKDEILLKFHLGVTKGEIDEILKKHNLVMADNESLSKIGYVKAKIPNGREVTEVIKEVSKEYKIKIPEPNYITGILAVSDPLYENQWYVPDTNFDKAWDVTKSKNSVKVAVIDTGVKTEHPDLKGKIQQGYDFVNNDSDASDDNGHGTFVAGVISATANDIGIKGLYDYAQVIPVKVIDTNGIGTYGDTAKGIIYAADNGAKVINLSIGGYGYSFMLQDAVDYALERGCIVVAAGGNDGIEQEIYPAAYPDVIGVSALGNNGQIWSSSNSGRHIDVSAPGANILSTGTDNDYVYATGTSASAPMVSALAGMLASERAELSSSVIERLIMQSAKDLGEKGIDKIYGSGEIDVLASLKQDVKPFHDVAVRSVNVEPMVFEKGKPTYIVANVENAGTYTSEKFDVVLYQIVGEEKKEIGRKEGIEVIDKIKVIFEWKPEGQREDIKFEVVVFLEDDTNSSNNLKRSYIFSLIERDGLYVLHKTKPPVHQWIAYQAKDIWSTSEVNFYINKNDYSNVWSTQNDPYCDFSSGTGYENSEGILVGACEEDEETISGAPSWCWFTNKPYCWHFWDPDVPQNGNYNYGYNGETSNYVRAQYLWDNYIMPNFPLNKDIAYYYLGRVVHLLEDLTVPAHVHNDGHPPVIDDDEYEEFVPGNQHDNAWGDGKNYQHFRGTNYSRQQYNYESVNFPVGVKTHPTNLFKLFWYVAQKTQYYASDEVDGNFFYKSEDNISNNFSPTLWSGENVTIIFTKGDVENSWGIGITENLKKIAEANIPHAMKAVAGLYRLFWNETHPIQITAKLTVTPQSSTYYKGQTISATYKIKNVGSEAVTLSKLTVGGRLNGDNSCSNTGGVCQDFTISQNVTFQPGEEKTYSGIRTLDYAGNYHFFIAYERNGTWYGDWNIPNESAETLPLSDIAKDISVVIDSSPPSVNITSPANNSTVSGAITVTVSASDNIGVKKVEYYLDNSTSIAWTANSSPFSWHWNTTTVSNGSHSIKAIAYDAANSTSSPSTINVNVNNIAGNNSPNTPSNLYQYKSDGVTGFPAGGTTNESTVVMKGTVTDPDNDAVLLEVEVKPVGTSFTYTPSSNCTTTSGTVASGGTAVVTCTGFENRQYHWQARAKDNKGAVSNWQSAGGNPESDPDFIVSATNPINNPPTVNITFPNGGETLTLGTPYDIRWTATDNTGTIQSVNIYSSSDGGATWSTVISNISNTGLYTWTAYPATTQGRIKVETVDSYGLAGNDISNSNFSITSSCQSPATPSLFDPGILTESGSFTIYWSNVSSATSYILQESSSPSFSGITEYQTTATSMPFSGKANGFYYYRIKAVNSCGSSGWSNTVDMEVRVNSAPYVPSNPNPYNGQPNVSRTPTLSWSGGDPDGTVEYAVRFGTEPNPGFYAGFGAVSGTSYQIPYTLEPATTYYWGVRARDDNGLITDSPVWSFTTAYDYSDIAITSFTVDGTIQNNSVVTANVTIVNQGNFAAPGAKLRFFYSTTMNGEDNEFVYDSVNFSALNPGQSTIISKQLTLKNLVAGTSYLVAKADTSGYFIENNFTNNKLSYTINYIDNTGPNISSFEFRWSSTGTYKTNQNTQFVYSVFDDIGVSGVDLYYSTDNEATWITIATNIPITNGGWGNSYNWTIPSNTPLNNTFKVKIVATDTTGNISSSILGPYTIIDGSAPSVIITSPVSGDVWDLGSAHNITWTISTPNGVAGIEILYSNGAMVDIIANLSTDTGSYSWTIPNYASYASTNARIKLKVTDGNYNETTAYSSYFTIRDASLPPPPPWTNPERLTTVPVISTPYTSQDHDSPAIETDSLGNLHMAYLYTEDSTANYMADSSSYPGRIITYKLYYKKRTGTTWSTPTLIKTIVNNQDYLDLAGSTRIESLKIAVDRNSNPHLSWCESNGNLSEIYYSYYNGISWQTPINVSNNFNVGTFSWSNVTYPPISGDRIRFAVIGNDIYASGFSYFLRLYKYSTTTNSWSQMSDISYLWSGVADGDMKALNGLIYAVDGGGNFKTYNPATDTWTTKANLLTSGSGVSLVPLNGKMYAIGAGGTDTLQEYDPLTNTWIYKAQMQNARNWSAAVAFNNKIFVIGGLIGGSGTRVVEAYDPISNTWTSKPETKIYDRRMGGAVVINNRIYLTGGYYASIEMYDPNINYWMPVGKLPTKMDGGDAAYVNGKLYVIDNNSFRQGTLSNFIDVTPTISEMPDLSVDSNDNAHIFWWDGRYYEGVDGQWWDNVGGTRSIYYRKFNFGSNTWSVATDLVTGGSWYDSAVSNDNTLHLSYVLYDDILNKIVVKYIKNNGYGWSTPIYVFPIYGEQFAHVSLTTDSLNDIHLAVRHWDSSSIEKLLYAKASGGVWSAPETIVGNISGQNYNSPLIYTNSDDVPVILYQKNNGNIYYAQRITTGQWTPGTVVNLASQYTGYYFDAAVDKTQNKIHLLYTASYSGHSEIYYNYADMSVDSVVPFISIMAPQTGEVLSTGSDYNIIWTASDNVGVATVSLKYTLDGGTTFTTIADNLANTGNYLWTVPNIFSDTVQIYAVATDSSGNQTVTNTGNFKITDLAGPSVTITSPAGGEIWDGGTTHDIIWQASDSNGISSINIYYSSDGGTTWVTESTGKANDGLYSWIVPSTASNNFRIKIIAIDGNGNSTSAISNVFTVKILNNPPAIPNNPLPIDGAVLNNTNAILQWQCNDPDGDIVTYDIYFGTTSTPPLVASAQTANDFSPSLSNNTTYYWKIVASDGKDTTSSPVWSFITGILPISAPLNLTAVVALNNQVSLSWTDNSNNESGFSIERKEGLNGTYTEIATVGQDAINYVDSGLKSNTVYVYRIRAYNGSVYSSYSNEAILTTGNTPPNLPSNPIPIDSALEQPLDITLVWSGDDVDLGDIITFDIYFGTTSDPQLVSSDQIDNFYNPGTLSPNTTYYWKVVAKDNYGASSASPLWYFVTGGYDLDGDSYSSNVDCDDNDPTINPGASDANCDGKDNNCNGQKDEGYIPTQTTCGVGVCASTGQSICQNGQIINACIPGQPTGNDYTCNGVDENCNGTSDENYTPTSTSCSTGICVSTGQLICQNGAIIDTCIPGQPQTEGPYGDPTCSDGIDNDCDATIDVSDISCGVALPSAIILPRTGQTKCYDSVSPWNEIPCTGTGQDGEMCAGVEWPNPRFMVTYCDATGPCTDQSSDCDGNASTDVVIDNLTGLMWARNGNLVGYMTWNSAIDYANSLTLCGYYDWSLPNINELVSLTNAEVTNSDTWLNAQGFTNVLGFNYWSSTTTVGSTDHAWSFVMANGGVGSYYHKNTNGSVFVWPVRSGQVGNPDPLYPANIWKTGQTISYRTGDDGDLEMGVAWPVPRFTDNSDGTVTDNLTGLVWLKNANCIQTNYPGFDNDYTYGDGGVTWQHALDFVKGINSGPYPDCGRGYSDWRLPNHKELISLIDYSNFSPALPIGHPFTNVQSYWSSTTEAGYTYYAWIVWMSGDVDAGGKDYDSYYVWPVRSGQVGGSFDYYCDNDNDTYISSSISGTCTGSGCVPVGCQTTQGDDCNDSNPNINPGIPDTNCNGIDENCSGTADESYLSTPTTCGIGACVSTGQLICVNGSTQDTCTPGTPQTEVCDSIDNNCDGQTDEGNVCGTPDLLVSSWTAPANACANAQISIKDTTKNQGAGTAGASQTCLYFSTNTTLDAGDTPLGCRAIPSLGASAVNTGTTSVTLPNVAIGKYYLIAMADDGNVVTESNETNNKKSKTIYIGPDLYVSALSAPTSATLDATISITDTTKNKGCGTAGASTTKFYLSTNTTINIGVDYELGTRPVPSLGTNAVSTGATSVVIPVGIPTGKYYIIANSDDSKVVVEGNEGNNKKTKAITINP